MRLSFIVQTIYLKL